MPQTKFLKGLPNRFLLHVFSSQLVAPPFCRFIPSLFLTSTSSSLSNVTEFNFKIYLKYDYVSPPHSMFRSPTFTSLLDYNNILLTDRSASMLQLTLNTQQYINKVALLKHKLDNVYLALISSGFLSIRLIALSLTQSSLARPSILLAYSQNIPGMLPLQGLYI